MFISSWLPWLHDIHFCLQDTSWDKHHVINVCRHQIFSLKDYFQWFTVEHKQNHTVCFLSSFRWFLYFLMVLQYVEWLSLNTCDVLLVFWLPASLMNWSNEPSAEFVLKYRKRSHGERSYLLTFSWSEDSVMVLSASTQTQIQQLSLNIFKCHYFYFMR